MSDTGRVCSVSVPTAVMLTLIFFGDVTCQIVSSDWKLEVYNSPACSAAVNGVLCLNRRWDPSFLA